MCGSSPFLRRPLSMHLSCAALIAAKRQTKMAVGGGPMHVALSGQLDPCGVWLCGLAPPCRGTTHKKTITHKQRGGVMRESTTHSTDDRPNALYQVALPLPADSDAHVFHKPHPGFPWRHGHVTTATDSYPIKRFLSPCELCPKTFTA